MRIVILDVKVTWLFQKPGHFTIKWLELAHAIQFCRLQKRKSIFF